MGAVSSRVGAILCLNLLASAAWAAETVTYTYDALGRLTTSSIVGGPSGGVQTTTGFDAAGNRSSYVVAGGQPSAPTFSVADATANEGSPATVTVTRSGPRNSTNTVQYSTANGTAVAGTNYQTASGTLTFAPGDITKSIVVSTIDDQIHTSNKAMSVALSAPSSGAAIGRSPGTVTIADIDVAPTLSINNTSVTEGGAAVLTVTRSGATGSPITVNYATANGTAVAPGDFTAASGSLSFAAGETSKTISVSTVNDTIYEPAENFTVVLSGASGATITSGTGTVTINDNDAPPVFSIANVTVGEAAGSAIVTVTKTGATSQASSVSYATSNGSAVSPGDYTATSGTLSFASGDTTKTISVPVINDTIYEAAETFAVGLSAPSGATISPTAGAATVTITDNETPPTFSISSNGSVAEGGAAVFTITKTGSTALSSSVNYATADGTATAPGFYTAASGSVAFSPTDTSKTVNVTTIANNYYDGTTNFKMNLASPSGASISTPQAVQNITDNTSPPSLSISSRNVSGGQIKANEGTTFVFDVSLLGNTRNPITVNYATHDGTATAGSDYTATSGTFSMTGNSATSVITVPTIDDTVIENDETFSVSISTSATVTMGTSQLTATIVNNDFTVQNPVANPDDAGTVAFCGQTSLNPIANDTDPGGLYPLTLVSASTPGFVATISGNTLELDKTQGGTVGTKTLTYVVKNTGGATATGNITVKVSGNICSNNLNTTDDPSSLDNSNSTDTPSD